MKTYKIPALLNSQNVLDELFNLFLTRGIPEHIRSDNGSEFTVKTVRKWLALVGVKTLNITPGSPGRTDILNHLMDNYGMNC